MKNLAQIYRQHLERICKQHNIQWLKLCSKRKGMKKYPLWASSTASPTLNKINVPPLPNSEPNPSPIFATALHEIGHVVEFNSLSYENQQVDILKTIAFSKYKYVSKYLLLREIAAWNIAEKLAGNLWTPKMTKFRNWILRSWFLFYNKSHKRKIFPKFFSPDFFESASLPSKIL